MADIELRYNRMPSVFSTYPKAMLGKKPALVPEGGGVPSMEASVGRVTAEPERVRRYSQVCGFPENDFLPITYPHILAMALQLHLIVNEAFPVRVMGLVHIGNTIVRHARIPIDCELGIRCFVSGYRESTKGQEFDMRTEVSSKDSVVWEESSNYLARRRPTNRQKSDEATPGTTSVFDDQGTISSGWNAPAGLGRRYAMVSGDFNPIHLSDVTARMLGFRAAIGHGMWSLARSLAEIGDERLGSRSRVEASFKLPVYLPSWLTFLSRAGEQRIDFLLSDSSGRKPHLSGICTGL